MSITFGVQLKQGPKLILAPEEWDRKTKRQGTLAEFFVKPPLRFSAIKLDRLSIRLRKVE